MHPAIEQHRDAIVQLCKRYHVKRLDVIGSAAGNDFDPGRSDLDFVVTFQDGREGLLFNRFFGLRDQTLAGLNRMGTHVDDQSKPEGVH